MWCLIEAPNAISAGKMVAYYERQTPEIQVRQVDAPENVGYAKPPAQEKGASQKLADATGECALLNSFGALWIFLHPATAKTIELAY